RGFYGPSIDGIVRIIAMVTGSVALWLRAHSLRRRSGLGADETGLGGRFRLALAVTCHEVDDARHDLGAETRAVEDAIMADLRLHVVRSHVLRDVHAQIVRRLRLADAGNVVILAFDGEQRDVLHRAQIDRFAAMLHPP